MARGNSKQAVKLWCDVYVAAIRNGDSNASAQHTADIALRDYKDKFQSKTI